MQKEDHITVTSIMGVSGNAKRNLITFKAHLTEIAIRLENFAKELLKGVLKAKTVLRQKLKVRAFRKQLYNSLFIFYKSKTCKYYSL